MTSHQSGNLALSVTISASRRGLIQGLLGGMLWANCQRGAAAQCELMELYPGYPGYRGYITGLDSVGDHACLEDLLAADAFFDPQVEDRANQEAAARLGLAGTMAEWTWEN